MKKTLLITGGAKSLGSAISKIFASHGFDIILTYLTSEKEAKELKSNLENLYHINVQTYKLNLENDYEIEQLFKNVTSLDVLINNAAYNNDTHWQDKNRRDFLHTLNINTVAPFIMAKYAYPLLKKNKGSIINISSTNGIDTMYTDSLDYDASKSALNNLTQNLSVAFSPYVRVNAIAAGWINTHNTEDMESNFKNYNLEKILLGRFAEPEEIAELAYFLASSKSSYITGSIIKIDGGNKYGN